MMKFSGIDLHSNNSVVLISDEADRIVYQKRLPNDLAQIVAALEPHRDELVGVAMDARFNAGLGPGPKFVTRWAIGCIAAIAIAGSTWAETPVERGSYLVNGILTCGNCHTPRSSSGAWDMSKQLSGRPRTWDEATFKVNAANITPDLETGIGKWSDADIKRSLLTGVRPNGTQIAPIMPYGFYKVFTPVDVDAVVAYLKSVLAVP